MKLTEYTTQVLKNFSAINSNIVFSAGDTLSTISEARNVMSTATIDQQIPSDFGIYDLNEFLGVLSLVDEPQMKIEEKYAVVGDTTGRSKIKYFFTDIDMLTTPKQSQLEKAQAFTNFEVNFTLDQDTMNKIKRAVSALGHKVVSVTPSNGAITLTVLDPENSTSNTFSIEIPGTYESEDFNFTWNIENLKILPGDYNVQMSSKLMSKWVHTEANVTYWIAIEKSSTYGAQNMSDQIRDIAARVGRSTIAVIDTVVQRGGFRGEELTTIGQLRDQCVQMNALCEQAELDKDDE